MEWKGQINVDCIALDCYKNSIFIDFDLKKRKPSAKKIIAIATFLFSIFIIDTCSLHWLIIWNRSRDCCDIWSGASNLLTELKQKVALIGRWKPPKQKPPMEQCWYIYQQRNTIVSHLCSTFKISVTKQPIPTSHFYVRIKLRENWAECGNLPAEKKRWVTMR